MLWINLAYFLFWSSISVIFIIFNILIASLVKSKNVMPFIPSQFLWLFKKYILGSKLSFKHISDILPLVLTHSAHIFYILMNAHTYTYKWPNYDMYASMCEYRLFGQRLWCLLLNGRYFLCGLISSMLSNSIGLIEKNSTNSFGFRDLYVSIRPNVQLCYWSFSFSFLSIRCSDAALLFAPEKKLSLFLLMTIYLSFSFHFGIYFLKVVNILSLV